MTSSVCHEFFSSCRGRRADHDGKNRTSIGLSYQKLWPIEVSASNSSKNCFWPCFLRPKLGLNRIKNPKQQFSQKLRFCHWSLKLHISQSRSLLTKCFIWNLIDFSSSTRWCWWIFHWRYFVKFHLCGSHFPFWIFKLLRHVTFS